MKREYDKFGHFIIRKNPIFKTGILQYAPSEVGVISDKSLIDVYRDAEQVKKVADSLIGVPIIVGHTMLCGENSDIGYSCSLSEDVKIIGSVIGNIVIEDGVGYADLSLWQEPKEDALEFSVGMDAEMANQNGITADGEKYDMIQVINTFNHLAFVSRGRAGRGVKILDSGEKMEEETAVTLDTIMGELKKISDRLEKLEAIEKEEGDSTLDAAPKKEITDTELEPEKKGVMDSGEISRMIRDAVALSNLENIKKQKAYDLGSKHVGVFNCATMDSGAVIGYVAEKLNIPKTMDAIIAFDSAKASSAVLDNATPKPSMSEDIFMAEFLN